MKVSSHLLRKIAIQEGDRLYQNGRRSMYRWMPVAIGIGYIIGYFVFG